MKNTKTIMVIALISIVICGLPGCILLIPGINAFMNNIGSINDFQDLFDDLLFGFSKGGWMVCLAGLFILVPFVLVIIAVVSRGKQKKVETLEPTGISKDDPIPPTT